jgi:hypothetical protein
MPNSSDYKGTNPVNPELPKVTSGGQIQPKDINNLSRGIDKTMIKSDASGVGKDFLIKQGSTGTTIKLKKPANNYPFQVQEDTGYFIISYGRIFSSYNDAQNITAINGFQSSALTGSAIQGANLYIDIEGCSISNTHKKSPNDGNLAFPSAIGTCYIQYSCYLGEKTLMEGSNTPVVESAKGTWQYVMRFAGAGEIIPNNSYIIFTKIPTGQVIQNIRSDIFDGARRPRGLEVSADSTKIYVQTGCLCGVVPKYSNGTKLNATSGSKGEAHSATTTDKFVFLEIGATTTVPPQFPTTVTVKVGEYMPVDTLLKCHIPLATYRKETNSGVDTIRVTQLVSGSLWASRLRYGDEVLYQFWKV